MIIIWQYKWHTCAVNVPVIPKVWGVLFFAPPIFLFWARGNCPSTSPSGLLTTMFRLPSSKPSPRWYKGLNCRVQRSTLPQVYHPEKYLFQVESPRPPQTKYTDSNSNMDNWPLEPKVWGALFCAPPIFLFWARGNCPSTSPSGPLTWDCSCDWNINCFK